jgi:HSP20 family protein
MLALWNHFDDLLAEGASRRHAPAARGHVLTPSAFVPPVDIEETKQGYLLTVDVPGLSAADVDVSVEGGVLTITGERKSNDVKEQNGYRRVERTFGSFRRSFTLPKGAVTEKITAHTDNGQLQITIPKPEEQKPRKILVGSAKT